jgi:CheY-like chemotaxis protein
MVGVESAGLGQGATFKITLPPPLPDGLSYNAPRMSATRSEITMSDSAPKLSGLRALVVDDQADERDLLAAALSIQEAEVRTAGDINEAMRIVTAWRPEIVISDIAMPDGGGYELVRRMRSAGIKAPAIAITAYASDEDRIRAFAAGFQIHLPKPAELYELVMSIASLTGRLT